ncbi:hypothetical protein ACGFI5_13785 [Micromonospora tulbaghiae]|uniref:Uncharacterized protein n=1 Tax=Micromonospora tulbaghiae TaxID=479978 RepID=A0ABY0KUX2_9ACTN|nr:hypothetical protein [Micromonospora tulbaghiae]MDX5460745.1 hypothetical protein [Micromonospora tulbaghiae]SCF14504.1 hypothetical protein GA0070562_0589 [Micromonospora tulbaghiae]
MRIRHRIHTQIRQGDRPLTDLLDDELDDTALLQQVKGHMAVAELQHLRLDWVTADPLPHVSSPYICFRRSAARSGHCRPTRIDREFGPDQKTRWGPADVFTFPPQTLRRFATDPDSTVRHAGAGHPNLPVHVRRVLLADSSEWVEQAR